MDLQVLLTSTVVAAVISMLTNVYNSKRTGNLKYITEERQKWREEIRQIAEDIIPCSQFSIKKYLIRLKVRINAEGLYNEKSYLEDSHIWKVIDDLEDNKCIDNFENNKKKLVLYLSALLKYDWERNKQEVRGSSLEQLQITFSFLLCGSFLCISYISGVDFGKNQLEVVLALLLPCVLLPIYKQMLNILKMKKIVIWVIMIIGTIVFVLDIFVVGGNILEVNLTEMQISFFVYIGVFGIFIATLIMAILNFWSLGTKDYKYIRLIENIENHN